LKDNARWKGDEWTQQEKSVDRDKEQEEVEEEEKN
jgi:hypothetical protein